jgi:acetolactate synthase-1/2/3 large subunit
VEITAATGLARILKEEGIDWVATFPVSSVNNTLAKEGIKLIMMRDERYAVALADAYSRVTGGKKIGVCTVMGGSNPAGLQFAFPGLAQAYEDSSPLLCIGDGLSPGEVGQSNWNLHSGLDSVTKWAGHVDRADRVPEFTRRAFTSLRNGHPGPVLLTFPRALGEYSEEEHTYTAVKKWRYAPEKEDVETAVKKLLNAKKPLIYAGHGVFFADATEELKQLAEALQIPVVATLNGKSCFPENHRLSAGVRGEAAVKMMNECDVLLAVGTSLAKGHFRHSIPDAEKKYVIQCTIDEQDVNRTFRTDIALLGDAKLTLQAMLGVLASQERSTGGNGQAWLDMLDSAKKEFRAKYQPFMESDEKPINPYRVYGDLLKVIDRENSFISPDSGNTRDQTSTAIETIVPHGFLGWGNVSTLGFSLAAAMAAKLAYPERQCVNITGDAGLNYMIGNFEPLVHYGIGTTTIHINNDGFSGYGPGFWGEGHDPYTAEVTDHQVTHTAEAVKAMGLYAERITEPEEIIPAMERAFKENEKNKPALLEFICSRYPVLGAWA